MKTKMNIVLAVVATLLLGSCAVTDVAQEADFSKYKTFGFGKAEIRVNNPAYKSGLINSKIKKGVKDEFAKHGLVYAKKNPDLLVSYQTYAETKEEMTAGAFNPMYFRGGLWGPYYAPYGFFGPYGYGMNQRYQYTEGMLIIDITDASTKEQVWRGMVKGNVTDVKTLQKSISKGVKAIMKKYPGSVDPNRQEIDTRKKKDS